MAGLIEASKNGVEADVVAHLTAGVDVHVIDVRVQLDLDDLIIPCSY